MSTRRDMEVREVREVFRQAWASTSAGAELCEDKDSSELAATGEALVTKSIGEAAPSVAPCAVELPVEGEMAGVKVSGSVEIVGVEGRVLDFKTALKRPNGVTAECGLQLTTYVMIAPGASGSCRL